MKVGFVPSARPPVGFNVNRFGIGSAAEGVLRGDSAPAEDETGVAFENYRERMIERVKLALQAPVQLRNRHCETHAAAIAIAHLSKLIQEALHRLSSLWFPLHKGMVGHTIVTLQQR